MDTKITRKEFIESKQGGKRANLQINLTEEENREIEQKALKLGVTRANYVKSILFYND